MIVLRDYQNGLVCQIRGLFSRAVRSVLLQLCTGGGKTRIFCYIAKHAAKKGSRVWILAHRKELFRQISKSLTEEGVRFGYIASGKPETPFLQIHIVSVQTVVRRLDHVRAPDLIITDECHHCLASSYATTYKKFPDAFNLGVTATPWRLNGAGLGRKSGGFYDEMIVGPSVRELTSRGFLAPCRFYAPPVGVDLTGVETTAGDFNKDQLAAALDKPKITGSAVEHYTRLCPGKRAIVFCCSIKHAEHVVEEFNWAGFRAALIDGEMDDKTRFDLIDQLTDHRLQLLMSVDLLGEGVDVPVVEVGIGLRPTYSLVVHLQQIGRILRPADGKTEAIWLDHVGNLARHGFPTDDRQWTLEGEPPGKKKKQTTSVKIRQCPECFRVHEPAPVCPQCGFVYPVTGRQVQQVDGKLVELNPEEAVARQQALDAREAKERAHLETIAKARGYKPNWVGHILAARRAKREQGSKEDAA